MPLTGEQIFVKCLRTALLAGTAYILFALGELMLTMTCNQEQYPGAFLWPWLLSLLVLAIYSKFDFMRTGLFKANVIAVRVAAALLLSTELVVIAHLSTQLSTCQGADDGMILAPGFFLLLYTAIALSLLFGDAWLGVIRTIIRLGKRPFDLSPADDEDPVEAICNQSRRARRRSR